MTIARALSVALVLLSMASPVRAGQRSPDVAPTVTSIERLRSQISELEQQVQRLTARLALLAGAMEPSAAGSGSAEPDALVTRRQLDEIDQRLRVLSRQLELEREQTVERARQTPSVVAGREGFQLRSADGSFAVKFRGLVHSDGRFFAGDTAGTASDTFVMRRVRPIIEATVFRNFDFRVVPDFGEGRAVLQDAYLDLRFTPALRVRGGRFKSPFGLERLVSASDLLFVERALPTAVAPNRDVGLMIYGDLAGGRTSYAAGLFNGVPDGSSGDTDDRDGKDLVARVFTHPFQKSRHASVQSLGFGAAASYGRQRGSAIAPSLPNYRSAGQQVFFRYRLDTSPDGTTVADGARYRVSAQGYYYAGPFGILAEQVFSSQDVRRGPTTGRATANAWQAAGSWVVTGERASYWGVSPRSPFDPGAGGRGAVELAVRFSELRVGDGAFPIFASPTTSAARARALAGGLNWYFNRSVKMVVDYEETRFRGGAINGNRPTERTLSTRLQLAF